MHDQIRVLEGVASGLKLNLALTRKAREIDPLLPRVSPLQLSTVRV